MLRFIFRRIIAGIPVLFVVSVVVFLIMHLTPGDPAATMLGPEASPTDVDALRHQLGLDQPILTQYAVWIEGVLRGDLGQSIFLHKAVAAAVGEQIQPTLYLALVAELIAVLIGVPAGIIAAHKQGRSTDLLVIAGAVLGTSLPSFLLGLLLILVFSVGLQWLPSAGYRPPDQGIGPFLSTIILPALALAVMQAALIARMTRTSVIEVLHQNYVTVAQAKGLDGRTITFKHVLRNGALPILTVVAQSFGLLLSGAIVIETVFNVPGIGQLTINAISRRDYPVIQGVVLTTATIYVLINLVVDVLYGVLDPRVRVKA
ncbi:ABC transporter permease [Brooklawnia cerclae]|uniref:Peptide/nickel transport system permease protein n=1 Tax=Brooklawnia cerclae TaxID=349934 RepID=A0ABX0SHS8_9ACTN|nr:peptide/nickel transport system permease protein [Brooklawnia cerclae]